ncbi:DUF4255 domain-containing protein [Leifsonia sp. Leaf264]|uniref:DUF4255 domain-containing protein n=1 Tax=Leifsonia sp. Leaf264 TaxID=1736314 RepID=UPI0006F62EC0|nr:DUF4255 domain-containing protein [Leifsonia sp. Leaf264]KQO96740.1 hypothetical protein ASF30_16725 [Leifsonia sp. Leaf264]
MIGEIDDAMRSLVRNAQGIGKDIDVVLDAPTTEWAARRNAPTVNLFLYDIREDTRKRETGFLEERDEKGIVISRTPAPRYYKLSYLVTAWTQRPDDEHRLLDALIRCFLRYDAIPEALVVETLAETGLQASMSVALPPPEDRAFADVWSSLGGELKPSLDVVVTAPISTGIVYRVGPPVTGGVSSDFEWMGVGAAENRVGPTVREG